MPTSCHSTVYSREECFPFGENAFGGYGKKRYRFTGKERDDGSGLYYFGARYYAPWLCRFTSVDPLWNKAPSECPYCYVGNNPIIYIDPLGLSKQKSGNKDGGIGNNSGYAKKKQKLDKKVDNLQSEMDDFSSKVKSGEVSQKEIDSQTKKFEDQAKKLTKKFNKLESKYQSKLTGIDNPLELKITGGILAGSGEGKNSFSFDSNSPSSEASSYIYIDGLTQANGQDLQLSSNDVILESNLNVNVNVDSGTASVDVSGSQSMPIGGEREGEVTLDSMPDLGGEYSKEFKNMAPAEPGVDSIKQLTDKNNTAGYAVDTNPGPSGNAEGSIDMKLNVTIYRPLKVSYGFSK